MASRALAVFEAHQAMGVERLSRGLRPETRHPEGPADRRTRVAVAYLMMCCMAVGAGVACVLSAPLLTVAAGVYAIHGATMMARVWNGEFAAQGI